MRKKLTIEDLKKIYLNFQEESNKLYDKYRNNEISKEVMETLGDKITSKFINEVISYDLSDIPSSFYRVILCESIDLSETHANIDFDVTIIDYNYKYNFKGCNITNLDKLDYKFLINNKAAFDQSVIDMYPYLFEELCVLEIGNIKIKYLNNPDALKKAQELSNYLEDKLDLITNINEIHITNGKSCINDNIMTLNYKYNVRENFEIIERENNALYKEIRSIIDRNNVDLVFIKTMVLKDFNTYFSENKLESSDYIKLFLYYSKDFELLSDYINNNAVEPIIDKYFKTLVVDCINYYFEKTKDEFLDTNLDRFTDYFWTNLTINSKKYLNAEESKEEIIDIDSLNDEQINEEFLNLFGWSKQDDSKEEKISNEQIIDITKKILFEIDNSGELINCFNDALNQNKIKFDGDDNYYSPYEDLIYIKNKNNYTTVRTLIHEFFHYYSTMYSRNNIKDSAYLGEIASIFFESYAVKYMKEKYGIDESKIDFTYERESLNMMNNVDINFILELYKIKMKRNITYEDIVKNDLFSSTDVALELLSIFSSKPVLEKYFIEKNCLKTTMPFLQNNFLNNNILLNRGEKVLISYTLGTELAKKYSSNPEYVEMFLNLARCAKNAEYNEAEVFRDLLESLNKENTKQ